ERIFGPVHFAAVAEAERAVAASLVGQHELAAALEHLEHGRAAAAQAPARPRPYLLTDLLSDEGDCLTRMGRFREARARHELAQQTVRPLEPTYLVGGVLDN